MVRTDALDLFNRYNLICINYTPTLLLVNTIFAILLKLNIFVMVSAIFFAALHFLDRAAPVDV